MEKAEAEFEIPEFPISETQPDIQNDQVWKIFKIEWLIMGALVFISIVAWAETLQVVINLYMTSQSEVNPYSRFVYSIIITGITIIAIWFFERQHLKG